jgi:outer membrane usher protein
MLHCLLLLLFSLPAHAAPKLLAPVMLDGDNLGEVWLLKKDDPEVETKGFLKAMAKVLVPEALEHLKARRKAPYLPLSSLKKEGITIRFDETTLILLLQLEDSIRARKNLRVRRETESDRETLGPAPFSGYLNATATQGFQYPRAAATRNPFRGNLALTSNWLGYVLETGTTYTEKDEYEWKRDDTRLVKDLEGHLLRFTLGDQPIYTSGYQTSREIGGLSVTRQFSIQPYLNTRPLNRTELLVKRPSTIEVFVNGGFVNRISASPGPIQLTDFPLFSGVNKVDLKITDDTGHVEWINLNFLYDVQLLGRGIQQFAYHVGAPSTTFGNDRIYDEKNISFSFFHRAGLSDLFTLGGGLQLDSQMALLTQDAVLLTRGGLFSLESGLSRLSAGLAAGAARLRYKSLDYKLGADRTLRGTAELEYKARRFATLGQLNPNPYSWHYGLSLSRPITPSTSAGLGFDYMVSREGADNRSLRFDFNSEFNSSWRGTFNYTLEKEDRLEHRFQFVLTWVESDGKYYGNLSYDYPSKTTRIEAVRNPSAVVDDLRANLGVQNSPSSLQGDALLEYTHEKANLRVEHASAKIKNPEGEHGFSNTTTFTASTALAWAGGAVAWTRPISDSFVLIKARPLYRDFPVPVNRNGENHEAVVNHLGPAVVPTLTSYNETPVSLDSSAIPVGYTLGREYFLARPTYHSGIRVDIGGESTAVLSGRLLQPDGKALSLATGRVAGPSGSTSFFTNREGRFILENLPPGDYQMIVDDENFLPMSLSVGKDQVGFIKLGDLRLKGANP